MNLQDDNEAVAAVHNFVTEVVREFKCSASERRLLTLFVLYYLWDLWLQNNQTKPPSKRGGIDKTKTARGLFNTDTLQFMDILRAEFPLLSSGKCYSDTFKTSKRNKLLSARNFSYHKKRLLKDILFTADNVTGNNLTPGIKEVIKKEIKILINHLRLIKGLAKNYKPLRRR